MDQLQSSLDQCFFFLTSLQWLLDNIELPITKSYHVKVTFLYILET